MNRHLSLLLGIIAVILSILPFWLLVETWAEGRRSARVAAFRRARAANEAALAILRNQEAAFSAMEDRCDIFTRGLARATPASTNLERFSAPEVYAEARKRAQPAFRGLLREGVKPLAGIWMGMHIDRKVILEPNIKPTFSLLHSFGFSSRRQERGFLDLLQVLIPGSFAAEDPETAAAVDKQIPALLGIRQTLPSLIGEMRGRCSAVIWNGQPAWLFWQILYPRDITSRVRDLPARLVYGDTGSRFTRIARRFAILGGYLLIIPRQDRDTVDPAGRLRLIEPGLDQKTALGLIDPASGRVWRGPRLRALRKHPSFTTAALHHLLTGTAQDSKPPETGAEKTGHDRRREEWVIATASFMLDRPMIGLASTRILGASAAPLPPILDSPLKRLGVILLLALGWLAGWQAIRGAAQTSLRIQFGLGFALAALLPLALLFAVSQRLADERFEEEITRARNTLRNDLSEIESRHLVQRSWHFRFLRSLNFNPALGKRLAAAVPDKAWLQRFVNDTFSRVFDPPIDLSVRYLTLVGPNRFSVQYIREQGEQSDLLGIMLEYLTEQALQQINPAAAGGLKTEPALDRREIAAEMARSGLANSFGPEFYYGIHHVSDDPMIITAGYGTLMLKTGFIPDARNPKGAMIWFIGGKHSDVQAMRRILHGQGRIPRLIAQSRDLLGMDTLPEEGANHTFLRRLIRRLILTESPISMQLEEGNRTWLIEGRPPILSRQFLYLGIEALDPILERAAQARRSLLFRLALTVLGLVLLAWAATRDLLIPLRQLTIGMQAIEAGDFTWRSDLRRGDEFEQLGEAFNQMARGLEEGRVMGRMVSATARAAMASAADEAQAREGSRRPATVLFLQCIGVSDALPLGDPAAILASLSDTTARVGRIVEAGGGDLDKLLGEKILAVFFHDRQPAREATISAIKAALALTAGQSRLSGSHDPGSGATDGCPVFPLVAGISTGIVISGLLGAGARRDFTIIGDPVNTAARCTSFAAKLPADQSRVVVTDMAWNLAAPVFTGFSLPPVSLKGKTTPIVLYQVTDVDRD